ncbi:hypothetical protein BKA23_2352 [Rudaeicoccus suwonensis]|uniref:Uncharacterized protein n=1 Tax=Rudaeicoccus suwonensis TaxID=657409 RepID=A0A561E307_9MICO|nr:hypothetical protein BKA23_2352 [Rudaeicoccus suwonensis]
MPSAAAGRPVTKRASCGCRLGARPGTSGPNVDCLRVGAGVGCGGRRTPVRRSCEQVYSDRRAVTRLECRPGEADNPHWPRQSARTPSRPARTESQIRCASPAPATTASAQWISHRRTPSVVPVLYAASAPW